MKSGKMRLCKKAQTEISLLLIGDVMAVQTATPVRPPAYPSKSLMGVVRDFQQEPLWFFYNAAKEYGDVVKLRFGNTTNYLISHPDGAQHILQMNNRNYTRQKFSIDLIKLVTGLNLFTSDGDYWRRQRRMAQPAFHRRRIEGFGEIMAKSTQRMLARWDAHTGKTLDMHSEMTKLTTEITGRALFSVDLADESSMLGKAFAISTEYINYRFSHLLSPPLFIPTQRNRKLKWALRTTEQTLQDMIDERRRTGEVKDDLMQMFMEARDEDTGEPMSDEQLRNELGIMIGAGQETTSNAVTWTFAMLARHPEVEQRLLEEIESVLGNRAPSMPDVPNLTYTRMVLDETMRLYPPAYLITSRRVLEDDEILGYHIPAGHGVMVAPFNIHRDPRFWEHPDTFNPDHFAPENVAGRHKYAYLPFGAGPRKCIGNTFALTEAVIIIASIVQRYRVCVPDDYVIDPEPVFTLQVKGGLPFTLEPR